MMINTEAANTKRMREHRLGKRQDVTVNTYEEIDLGVCSSVIDYVTSNALNARIDSASLKAIIQANPNGVSMLSDADQQLILKIHFKDPVTITCLSLRADKTPESMENVSGPRSVKFYANRDDLDFSEVEDVQASQTAIIEPADLLSEARIMLRGNKFQRLNSLQIFIEDNQGDLECTFINRIQLRGFVLPPYAQQHLIK